MSNVLVLVKVNVNVLHKVPIRSCSCARQSWEDGLQVDGGFEDLAQDLGY